MLPSTTLHRTTLILTLLLVIGLLFPFSPAQADTTPVPGVRAAAQLYGAVRYTALSDSTPDTGSEVYLGVPEITGASHRTESQVDWDSGPNTFSFTYTPYDPADPANPLKDRLVSVVANSTGTYTTVFAGFSSQVAKFMFGEDVAAARAALQTMNYFSFTLTFLKDSTGSISLDNLVLNGAPVGSYPAVFGSTVGYHMVDVNLGAGFTLTGELSVSGFTPGTRINDQHNKVQFNVGWIETGLPLVGSLLAAPDPAAPGETIELTGSVDDSSSGGSQISGAEYSLDGGAWTPMSAADGSFDSSLEAVVASLPAPVLAGDFTLCVRGLDASGNYSEPVCLTLSVVDTLGPLTSDFDWAAGSPQIGVPSSFTARVSDLTAGGANILSAEYSLDGGAWTPLSATDGTFDSPEEWVDGSFTVTDDTASYDLCLRGTDTLSNPGEALCINFSAVDNRGPVVSDIAWAGGSPLLGGMSTFRATVSDLPAGGADLSGAEFSIDGGAWLPLSAADGAFDRASEGVRGSFATSVVADSYQVCVRGTDIHANTGDAACATLFVLDTLGPTVSDFDWAAGSPQLGGLSTFTVQVDDSLTGSSNIVLIQYSLDNGASWSAATPLGVYASPVESATAAVIFAEAGSHAVCVRGSDSAGNTGEQECILFTLVEAQTRYFFPLINVLNP
jgi:hypothetical protein